MYRFNMRWDDLYFAHNPKGFNVKHITTNKKKIWPLSLLVAVFSVGYFCVNSDGEEKWYVHILNDFFFILTNEYGKSVNKTSDWRLTVNYVTVWGCQCFPT